MAKNSKRGSLKYQIKKVLDQKRAFGEPKHEDKRKNNQKPDPNKIYAATTYKNYMGHCMRFAVWVGEKYHCRSMEDARTHTGEYLYELVAGGKSEYTVRTVAAALAKAYDCETTDLGCELPKRVRSNITQHRSEGATWRGEFSEKNNASLVAFARATGLRRHEIAKVMPKDIVQHADGTVTVAVIRGKGGKSRVVTALNGAAVLEIAARGATFGMDKRMWGPDGTLGKIPSHAPIHEYRRAYAQKYYAQEVRNIHELVEKELYRCRGDMAGIVYDRKAMYIVSTMLGHNHLDVVTHYLA